MFTNGGAFGENFPYTNFHDLNLDWILRTLKEVLNTVENGKYSITFADPIEWDINSAYPELTVVVDNNVAYLSKVPVPEGTPITNTDYWTPIYDLNALFTELENLINTKVPKTDIYHGLDTTQPQLVLGADQGKVLRDMITNLGTTINNKLAEKEDIPSKRKLLFCGDSYTVWDSNALYNYFLQYSGQPSGQSACVAVSGASFYDQSNNFLTQVSTWSGNKQEITDIIVAGGINDALIQFETDTSSTFPDMSIVQNGILAFANYCRQNYPNAKLHMAYIGGCLPSSQYFDIWHPNKSQECALFCYTVYAQSVGFNILNTKNAIHLTKDNYGPDGLHPSQYGQMQIAQAIASEYNHEYTPYIRPRANYDTGVTGIVGTSTIKENLVVIEDNVEVTLSDGYMGVYPNSKLANVYKPILTLFNFYRYPKEFAFMGTLRGWDNNTGTVEVPMKAKIENNILYVAILDIQNGQYHEYTATESETYITIQNALSFTIPLYEMN